MIWRILILIVFTVWPSLPFAAPILVRSGEHSGFTRLVFYLNALQDWRVTQDGFSVTVVAVGAADGFQTDELYDRIGRTRLLALTEKTTDTAQLDLACDCIVETLLLRGRLLVVDIRARRENEPIPTASDLQVEQESFFPDGEQTKLLPKPTITLPLRTSVISTNLIVRMMQDEFGSAIVSGLILADDQIRVDRSNLAFPEIADPEEIIPEDLETKNRYCPIGLNEVTRLWRGDGLFNKKLSSIRQKMHNTAGRENEGARLELARFLVSNGVGIEVLDLLRDDSSEEAGLVRSMAQLLDRPRHVVNDAFQYCSGLEIWEIIRLSRQGKKGTSIYDNETLVIGFRGLSRPLQALFEAELLAYLSDNGFEQASAAIQAFRERTQAKSGHMILVDGRAVPLPKQIDEISILENILEQFGTLEGARAATPQQAAMIPTFQYEFQKTSWSPDLWQADLRLNLVSSDFDRALILTREGRLKYPAKFEQAYPEMLRYVTDNSDDISFLKIAMSIGTGEAGLPVPSAGVANHVEARLSKLGF